MKGEGGEYLEEDVTGISNEREGGSILEKTCGEYSVKGGSRWERTSKAFIMKVKELSMNYMHGSIPGFITVQCTQCPCHITVRQAHL